MNTTKYLLAKYLPDLHRFEPRNIGVIVWSPVGMEARFLAEYADRPGEVDGRSIPGFVTSASAYKQWIQYWREAISAGRISPVGSNELIAASSPAFLEALQQTGRGNFVVVESGAVLDAVSEENLPALADQLFAQLVEANPSDEGRDIGFDELCDALMARSRLTEHKNFHDRYPLKCNVRGIEEEFVISHAIANGTIERAYQRFPIPRRKGLIQKNRDATAWMLESLLENNLVTRDKTVLLVDATPKQIAQSEVDKTLKLLGSMSHVVNIHNEAEALAEFSLAAQIAAH